MGNDDACGLRIIGKYFVDSACQRQPITQCDVLAGDVDDLFHTDIRDAASRPDPDVDLPAHMRNTGDRRLRALLAPFGIEAGL